MHNLKSLYQGKNVFLTGHTGFKGAWLTLILQQLGARVTGYSLPPAVSPNLFELAEVFQDIRSIEGDIRDYLHLKKALLESKPDIVFHLAAQAIVLDGYKNPKDTFDINSGGTVNLLEVLRDSPQTKACIIVTTDKVYDNQQWLWGYRENDSLGGKDPYSASKSMAELAIEAYRNSFFSGLTKINPLLIASVRAGNIIGGGDFSSYRIVPDCMRALSKGIPIEVRNPSSARPWLYVLDALYGYLQLGADLLQGDISKAESWNFGPQENRAITVKEIVEKVISLWETGNWKDLSSNNPIQKEMPMLRLNWDKAANLLRWSPQSNWEKALELTVEWYRAYYNGDEIRTTCNEMIQKYSEKQFHEVYSHSP